MVVQDNINTGLVLVGLQVKARTKWFAAERRNHGGGGDVGTEGTTAGGKSC